jgi:hypothetical protein
MPKGPVETPITNQEMAYAHLVMAGTMTDREAAERVGIDPGRAAYVKAKPKVKEYMEQHRASVRAAIVQHESEILVGFNIGREQIMARYHELSMLPPDKTNGNITGQVKALDSLREMLGLVGPQGGANPDGEGDSKPQIYRAKWMRKPGDPDYEDDVEPGPDSFRPEWLDETKQGVRPEVQEHREPTPRTSESAPEPVRIDRLPAVISKSPAQLRDITPHHVEAPEPPYQMPGAGFGRFQGM